MNLKFGIRVLLWLFVCVTPGEAMISFRPRPLHDSILDAPVVVHVRIKEIHDRHFRLGSENFSCGSDYVVDVLTTFKGRPHVQRTFSAFGPPHALFLHKVRPGDELLVLLSARRKEESPASEPTDVLYSPTSRVELKCRAQLSLMTLSGDNAGGFPLILRPQTSASGQTHNAWLAYSVLRTEFPRALLDEKAPFDQNCSGLQCTDPLLLMVPWEPLKAEIHRWAREPKESGRRRRS
jgi:hypothetical protein